MRDVVQILIGHVAAQRTARWQTFVLDALLPPAGNNARELAVGADSLKQHMAGFRKTIDEVWSIRWDNQY